MRISIAAALALTTWIAIALGLMLTSAVHFISQPFALAITLFGPIAALASAYYARGSQQAFAVGALIPLAIGLWVSLGELSEFSTNPQTAFFKEVSLSPYVSYPDGGPFYAMPQNVSPPPQTLREYSLEEAVENHTKMTPIYTPNPESDLQPASPSTLQPAFQPNSVAIPQFAPMPSRRAWIAPFWRRTGTFSLLAIAGGFLSCLIQASVAKREANAQAGS